MPERVLALLSLANLARYSPSVWAIQPERLAALVDYANRMQASQSFSAEDIERYVAAVSAARVGRRSGGVARISVSGPIEPKASIWTLLFGGTGLDMLAAEFAAALVDNEIKGIVLDVDSPGGSVYGVPEMARAIREARGTKPILAVANAEAASAAYYLAAQADEVSVTPSGAVGSIGVVYLHTDLTGAAEKQGVRFRIFRSQERKADVNPYEPLSEDAAADIEAKVATYDRMFVQDVARGRGVTVDRVRGDYGAGRMLLAAEALKAGLVDRVETIDEAMARVAGGRVAVRQAAAATGENEAQIETKADPVRAARLWEIALAGRGG